MKIFVYILKPELLLQLIILKLFHCPNQDLQFFPINFPIQNLQFFPRKTPGNARKIAVRKKPREFQWQHICKADGNTQMNMSLCHKNNILPLAAVSCILQCCLTVTIAFWVQIWVLEFTLLPNAHTEMLKRCCEIMENFIMYVLNLS